MSETLNALHEDDHRRLQAIVGRLHTEINAKVTSLIDKDGRQIVVQGETGNVDLVSLACLTAGNVAATDGLARLLGEREFSILFHEGEHDNIHISVVAKRAILVIIFDERSSLGLVRLRVKKALTELEEVITTAVDRQEIRKQLFKAPGESPFAEITEDDIERLFRRR